MDESLSPRFTSDSFIPLPSESKSPRKARSNYERHLNTADERSTFCKLNSRNSHSQSLLAPWKSSDSLTYSCGVIG